MELNKGAIMMRMKAHRAAVEDLGYNVVYLALQGSQNYGLAYENSDIDTKAIIIPSSRDLILGKEMTSFTHVMENDEHCDVKDIRLMFANYRKQNINFLEILFTDFVLYNPMYMLDMKYTRMFREEIAHMNVTSAVNCMCGMAMEKHKALEHPYPTIKWKIDKWGYDGKQLHHIIRMRHFLENYLNAVPFLNCLTDVQAVRDVLMKAKRNEYTLEEARELAKQYMAEIKVLHDAYKNGEFAQVASFSKVAEQTSNLLDDVVVRVIKRSMATEAVPREDDL